MPAAGGCGLMLFICDLDGTLIEATLGRYTCPCGGPSVGGCERCYGRGFYHKHDDKTYDRVIWLPNRLPVLAELAHRGHDIAVATNQTGVYFGDLTSERVRAKMTRVSTQLCEQISPQDCFMLVCQEPGPDRKPEPGMLLNAMKLRGASRHETVMVGDMPPDRLAAERAGVAYCDATIFFRA